MEDFLRIRICGWFNRIFLGVHFPSHKVWSCRNQIEAKKKSRLILASSGFAVYEKKDNKI